MLSLGVDAGVRLDPHGGGGEASRGAAVDTPGSLGHTVPHGPAYFALMTWFSEPLAPSPSPPCACKSEAAAL